MTEMSETSSDTESSCGWTILSNESSDIETLGLEAAAEYGGELLERPPPEKTKLQDTQASGPAADCLVESVDDLLEGEQIVDEVPFASEARGNAAEKQPLPLLSASEHSDIVSLGEVKEEEQYELQAETSRMFYLGTPCSSQYTFTAAEPAVPVPQPPETDSSSNEDEETPSSSAAVRRRRFRKNTTSVMPEPEEEESGQSEEWKEKEDEGLQAEVGATDDLGNQTGRGEGGSVLNKCILFALVVAISMAFGHFHGTVQIQERQRTLETIRLNELDGVRNLLYQHVDEQPFKKQLQHGDFDLDDDMIVYLLTELIKKLTKENQELNVQQARIKTQRDELEVLLNQKAEEGAHVVTQQQSLTDENQLLKSSLEKEEKSASILQEELRNLRSKVKEREEMEPGIYSLLVENQQLKVQLEENKQVIQSFHIQKEDVMAEAQTLREKLDTEVKLTDELRREISFLSKKEENSEPEELQSQLTELERRLNMEQQRSDMWERLYVETKEERAKGDTESKVKNTKPGVAGKMKETFDAVKNSTKDFVHHHKEQIKKAKEAVKENLRKFSDSVKSTFRNFKDSASTFINNARGFYDKRSDEKHRSHKSTHKHSHQFDDPFQSDHNTRKSGGKVHEDRSDKTHKSSLRGCSEVFDCAHQESVTIFNKATDPIRADEFYQLLRSYLQQEVDYFHHWEDLEAFINSFFHNGVFIHDRMLFTDFVSSVEDYLADMQEYQGLNEDVFGDLDDYVYRHFFGDAFTKYYGPHRPFERPDTDIKDSKAKQRRRKQQKARSQPHSERKWRRSERNADRHMADVKIELGPMPFDPKY